MDFANWKKPAPKPEVKPKARVFDETRPKVLIKLISNMSNSDCGVSGLAGDKRIVPYEVAQEMYEAGHCEAIKYVEEGEEVKPVQAGFDNEAGHEEGEGQEESPASEDDDEEADEKPAQPDPIELLKAEAEKENAPYKEAQKASGGRRTQKLDKKLDEVKE